MSKRMRYAALAASVIVLVGALVRMVTLVDSGYEVTQMRNAFIASPGAESDFNWTPDAFPAQFLRDTGPAPADFRDVTRAVLAGAPAHASELERALLLARHLSEGPGPGPGVRSNTRHAYRTILSERRGYCSDYTQVMNGLAYAAEIPVREWGMSFDEYSGYGHGFSEIYDRELGKWILLDSFYSLYVVDAGSRTPLSVLELRQRLASGDDTDELEVRIINPERFGFKSPEKALAYYRRGVDAFFLYYGNNVFSYDANPVVAVLGRVSRALEESAGILLGIRPGIRLVRTETNHARIEALLFRRNVFLVLAMVAGLASLALVFQLSALRRQRRSHVPSTG